MPPRTQRSLLEDEQKRVKANAALLRGDDRGVESGKLANGVTDDRNGARGLIDNKFGGATVNDGTYAPADGQVPLIGGDPRAAVAEAIDPRGRTEILQAGDIDFSQNRGKDVLKTGVSAEDALAILRGNKPPQPDFAVRGTGIPALPSDIAQRRSDFAEESAAALAGGSREDRAKKLTEIRRPAVEAAAKIEADATAAQKVKDEIAIKSAAARVTAFSQELRTQWEIKGRGEISDAELADKVAERERAIVVQREDDKRKGLYVDSPEYETKMAAEVTNELLVADRQNEGRLAEIGLQGKNAKETVQLELDAKKEADRLQGKNVDSPEYRAGALSELNAKLDVDIAKAKLDNNSEAIARLESTKNQVILDRVSVVLESTLMNDRVKLEEIEKLQAELTSVDADPAEVAAAPVSEEQPFGTTRFGDGDDLNGDGRISTEEQQYNDASRIRNNKEQYDALTPAEQLRLNQRLSELKPIVIGN